MNILRILLITILFISGCERSVSNALDTVFNYQGIDFSGLEYVDIEQNEWRLLSYGFQFGQDSEILSNTNYELSFTATEKGESGNEGVVRGVIDCNSFQSTYITSVEPIVDENVPSANISSLVINEISLTEMACVLQENEEYQMQNDFIIDALRSVSSYQSFESIAYLYSTDSRKLTFVKIEPEEEIVE